jgi:hypothetical protein
MMEKTKLDPDDREFFALVIGTSQYRIVTILGDLEDPTTFSTSSFVHRSNHIAALLYLHSALREIVQGSTMQHHIVKRLKAALDEAGEDIILKWDDKLERLLWIAFNGGAAVEKIPERAFFVNILVQVTNLMMLSSLESFRSVIKRFGWVESFSAPHSFALWKEIQSLSMNDLPDAQELESLIAGEDALHSGYCIP